MNLTPVGLQRVLPGLAILGINLVDLHAAAIFLAEKRGLNCLRQLIELYLLKMQHDRCDRREFTM